MLSKALSETHALEIQNKQNPMENITNSLSKLRGELRSLIAVFILANQQSREILGQLN